MKIAGKLRSKKMKHIELTVLKQDVDAVIEFLGRQALLHFSYDDASQEEQYVETTAESEIQEKLDNISKAAIWLDISLPSEPEESFSYPGEAEKLLLSKVNLVINSLVKQENENREEKRKIEETLNEAKAFSKLNAAFTNLDQLSYLTLRVGRLDSRRQIELKETLAEHALIIPLDDNDNDASSSGRRILAAASRKGRFALDSELKKIDFVPISIPENFKGIPLEFLKGLEDRLVYTDTELEDIERRRKLLGEEYGAVLQRLSSSFLMAKMIVQLKNRLVSTENVFLLSGWVPNDKIKYLLNELEKLTQNRIAVRSYDPEEMEKIIKGREKVPVYMSHGAFVKGFENLVFTYGAPLYGTIDPTPFVAVSFCVLFGIMFGDLGQGMVLFLLGILTGLKGNFFLSRFKRFSVPLKAVGVTSMIMGILTGSFFTNEEILSGPVRALTELLFGYPMDRILTIMPLAEMGGSVSRLFYFFGFTVSIGVLINSAGLIVNIINQIVLKNYERALFSKTGFAGLMLFWYALFIAIRFIVSMLSADANPFSLTFIDAACLTFPMFLIFFGSALWRIICREKKILSEGFMTFFMEGFVEILDTVSGLISNTVSFLRVGAFALSHAVLAYIVFRFSEQVSEIPVGTFFSILILVFGNLVIILLEGLIVTIQVVRLQYYEFFSKFFTETGVEFNPFSFRKLK